MTASGPKASADRYWSQLVRLRGGCQYPGCGTPRNLEAAHIIRRRHVGDPDGTPLRTNLENGLALCHDHHAAIDADPVAFTQLVTATIGLDKYEELLKAKHAPHRRWAAKDWIRERVRLRELLKAAGSVDRDP